MHRISLLYITVHWSTSHNTTSVHCPVLHHTVCSASRSPGSLQTSLHRRGDASAGGGIPTGLFSSSPPFSFGERDSRDYFREQDSSRSRSRRVTKGGLIRCQCCRWPARLPWRGGSGRAHATPPAAGRGVPLEQPRRVRPRGLGSPLCALGVRGRKVDPGTNPETSTRNP